MEIKIKANRIKNYISLNTDKSYEITEFDDNLIIIVDTETRKIIDFHAGSIDWMDENVDIIHEYEVKTFGI